VAKLQVSSPSSVTFALLKRHLTGDELREEDIQEYLTLPIPGGHWRLEQGEDGFCLVNSRLRQSVIGSACVEADGKRWIHLSIASPDRLPTYEDLCWLKRMFLGEEAKAVMVFPPKSVHVNLHARALHLFSCLDLPDPLPEFSGFHPAAGGRRSI
jgi:hypothetical protein